MRALRASLAMLLACAAGACGGADSPTPVLLFAGTGASPNDVLAIEAILDASHIGHARADSGELDSLSEAELLQHRLLIMPGGNFEVMGNHLRPATSTRINSAVHHGLNYLGICGGAFMAGDSPYNGINLTGVRYRFYSAESHGIRKSAVLVSTPTGQPIEHYWEDGPQLAGWGAVVAKYPDGTPAVSQGRAGRGWIVLSGTHPEAPESWRGSMPFTTPASAANAYASKLIEAALSGTALPAYDSDR